MIQPPPQPTPVSPDSTNADPIEQGPLRPPSEARSLLVRVVRNCPWNRCAFCPAYKGDAFSIRPLDEVLRDIDRLADDTEHRNHSTAFLQDADALLAPSADLEAIMGRLKQRFPNLNRITAYARSNTLIQRTPEQLKTLRTAGLSRIHVGLETGSDEVLSLIQKGTTAATQREGCRRVREAGIELCCYVMPGLGGKRLSDVHARDTGNLIAEIAPEHVRLRTCMILEGTPLADLYLAGRFEPLSEEETVREIRTFLSLIAGTQTELVSDHRINLLLELSGRLPLERDRLLGIIDRFFALSPEERRLFIVGRRRNLLRRLDDLAKADDSLRQRLQQEAATFTMPIPVPRTILY